MTKSKLPNGACSNPLNRLIKRMEEHRRRHLISVTNHKSKTMTDIKANTELKNLLERKSKSSDNKTKKKRTTNPLSAINKKKAKQLEMSQKLHVNSSNGNSTNNYFCPSSLAMPELNPNVTLSMTTGSLVPQSNVILPSTVPDLDQEYTMQFNLNESEIDSVLNNEDSKILPNPQYQFIKKEEMTTTKPTALVKDAPLFPPPPSTHESSLQDSSMLNFPLNYPRNSQLSYNFTSSHHDPNTSYYYQHNTSNFPLPTMTGWYNGNNTPAKIPQQNSTNHFVQKYHHNQYPATPNDSSSVHMNHQFYSAPQYNPSLNVSLTNNISNNMYFISHTNNDNNTTANNASNNHSFHNNFYPPILR